MVMSGLIDSAFYHLWAGHYGLFRQWSTLYTQNYGQGVPFVFYDAKYEMMALLAEVRFSPMSAGQTSISSLELASCFLSLSSLPPAPPVGFTWEEALWQGRWGASWQRRALWEHSGERGKYGSESEQANNQPNFLGIERKIKAIGVQRKKRSFCAKVIRNDFLGKDDLWCRTWIPFYKPGKKGRYGRKVYAKMLQSPRKKKYLKIMT